MVFNVSFNNISVISLRSVLLVEETRVPEEHDRPVASHGQTFYIKISCLSNQNRYKHSRHTAKDANKGRRPYNGRLSDLSFYIDSQISVHRKFKK